MHKKAFLIGLVVVLLIAGAVLVTQKKKVDPAVNQHPTSENTTESETSVIYKNVRVSDGTVTFTFEVPKEWLVETRNDGEKQMTVQEMREFFKTNWESPDSPRSGYTDDYSKEEINTLNLQKLNDIFKKAKTTYLPGYPNASFSSNKWIYYGDGNGYQTDFYILSQTEAQKYLKTYSSERLVRETTINEFPAKIVSSKSNGDPGSGARRIFIDINKVHPSKMLLIIKQYYPEDQIQSDFDRVIQTLKFE